MRALVHCRLPETTQHLSPSAAMVTFGAVAGVLKPKKPLICIMRLANDA